MLNKIYFLVRGKVLELMSNKKGISQSIEVIGIVALVAGILTAIIPQARTTVTGIWNTVLTTAQTLFNNTAAGK